MQCSVRNVGKNTGFSYMCAREYMYVCVHVCVKQGHLTPLPVQLMPTISRKIMREGGFLPWWEGGVFSISFPVDTPLKTWKQEMLFSGILQNAVFKKSESLS